MPKKHYSRRERFYSALIALLFISAAILVLILVVQSKVGPANDATVQSAAPAVGVTPEPMTLRVTLPATEAPADASPTPAVTEPSATSLRAFEPLPVYSKADTEEKIIAITIDDCSHQGNVKAIAAYAAQMGAKLTLFPYGQGVMKEGMDAILQVCVFDLGFEVENRTWSDASLYRLSASEMATEIWSADIAVDYALDQDYSMHFFRMRGGSGAKDARTHEFLRQLGYDAIVNWTVSGTEATEERLRKSLSPGSIYQFTSSEADCQKMANFMRYAADQGYALVTLNQLLGYPENAYAAPEQAILSQKLPEPAAYEPVAVEHMIGDRAWQVYMIQSRLSELGYLTPQDVDGVYGDGTSSAISAFQGCHGLLGSGVASVETQSLLFSSAAKANPTPVTLPPQ